MGSPYPFALGFSRPNRACPCPIALKDGLRIHKNLARDAEPVRPNVMIGFGLATDNRHLFYPPMRFSLTFEDGPIQ
jgi:hypothetical protein